MLLRTFRREYLVTADPRLADAKDGLLISVSAKYVDGKIELTLDVL